LPERRRTGDKQIASRQPNIREHSIVEVGEACEFSAGENGLQSGLRQHRCGLADTAPTCDRAKPGTPDFCHKNPISNAG
jgi:hypothetical protein